MALITKPTKPGVVSRPLPRPKPRPPVRPPVARPPSAPDGWRLKELPAPNSKGVITLTLSAALKVFGRASWFLSALFTPSQLADGTLQGLIGNISSINDPVLQNARRAWNAGKPIDFAALRNASLQWNFQVPAGVTESLIQWPKPPKFTPPKINKKPPKATLVIVPDPFTPPKTPVVPKRNQSLPNPKVPAVPERTPGVEKQFGPKTPKQPKVPYNLQDWPKFTPQPRPVNPMPRTGPGQGRRRQPEWDPFPPSPVAPQEPDAPEDFWPEGDAPVLPARPNPWVRLSWEDAPEAIAFPRIAGWPEIVIEGRLRHGRPELRVRARNVRGRPNRPERDKKNSRDSLVYGMHKLITNVWGEVSEIREIWEILQANLTTKLGTRLSAIRGRVDPVLAFKGWLSGELDLDVAGFLLDYAVNHAEDALIGRLSQAVTDGELRVSNSDMTINKRLNSIRRTSIQIGVY